MPLIKEESIAILTIRGLDKAKMKEKGKIAAWLRSNADDLVDKQYSYCKKFTARFIKTTK